MREATGKCGKIEEIILSCPPGSERLATALSQTHDIRRCLIHTTGEERGKISVHKSKISCDWYMNKSRFFLAKFSLNSRDLFLNLRRLVKMTKPFWI